MIYIGTDHRGFELKEKIIEKLRAYEYPYEDFGAFDFNANDDYTDIALKVAEIVSKDNYNRGILLCGSGAGVCVAANKVKGIRAAVIDSLSITKKSREDDDINVICLPADFIDENLAWELIGVFLNTEFQATKNHLRRIKKISAYEKIN